MSSAPTTLNDLDDPAPESRPIDRVIRPLTSFAHNRLAGAGLLMAATVAALLWANSPWTESYHHLLDTTLRVELGGATLEKSFHHFINDGLMAIFFFYVGLEIKREVLTGELSDRRKATLPAVAALGGMLVPALIYTALNFGETTAEGWGIPMATDIAFALGVLALLGDRVSTGLKVFLTALAIVDDIGAVLVIALFYTDGIALTALLGGVACIAVSAALNRLGARATWVYYVLGLLAWLGFVESGVHATIAAVLLAFTIPARTRIDGEAFDESMGHLMERMRRDGLPEDTTLNTGPQQKLFETMDQTIDLASAPAQRIERALHGPVTFVVLPIFALANAGVDMHGLDVGAAVSSPVVLGIVSGLALGKLTGIMASSYLAVRVGIADLPEGVSWTKLAGVGLLAGIGFTMALFIANLAFDDHARVEAAKLGILGASVLSGLLGYALLRRATR